MNTGNNLKQKYNKGDHVRVVKDLGRCMSHFQSDCEAIIVGSNHDQYCGGKTSSYTIYIRGRGEVSWYHEHQLKIIEKNRLDLLEQWVADVKNEVNIKSDLNWIFSSGEQVLKDLHGATIAALARCFGLMNLWGDRGEGIDYYYNANLTINLAKPFLESGDKEAWLAYCEVIKQYRDVLKQTVSTSEAAV